MSTKYKALKQPQQVTAARSTLMHSDIAVIFLVFLVKSKKAASFSSIFQNVHHFHFSISGSKGVYPLAAACNAL
jgi:hypothetical protein